MRIKNLQCRKSLLVAIIILVLPISIQACVHQTSQGKDFITCLVMDSTKALIGNAHVHFSDGNTPQQTRWDGRVLFVPQTERVRLTITAEGYEKKTVVLTMSDTRSPYLIVLRPDPKAIKKDADFCKTHTYMSRAVKAYGGGTMAIEKAETSITSMVSADAMVLSAMAESPMPTIANSLSAGQLTAGEVNDFSKWLLWDSVLHGSHKDYIGDWRIQADDRYMVQVTTKQGFPIVNRGVSLVDAQGNTLFQARTDNTGKAELWNGLIHGRESGQLYVQVDNMREKADQFACKDMQMTASHSMMLDEDCESPTTADVFFIVDATGSMSDEIRYLQAEMQDVILRSQSAVGGLHIRTGALVYRDHGDEYVTRISRLTDDITTTQQFINLQSANGGGDYEEAIPEALLATINAAGWNDEARTRIAFLLLDAPCHRDSATLSLLHEQVLSAAAMGIRIVPVVCSGVQGSGELLLRQLALATNGTSFFLTDDSGIGDSHIKPTTDTLRVEHLNDMMVRTIVEFASMPTCDRLTEINSETIEPFLPKPSAETDNLSQPSLSASDVLAVTPNPCSDKCLVTLKRNVEGLYLMDITGKTILSWHKKEAGEYAVSMRNLSVGAYFFMAYTEGRWVTQKIIRQ